jgi:leader peptidase (prepilin peptidase)/N-methyltransferase
VTVTPTSRPGPARSSGLFRHFDRHSALARLLFGLAAVVAVFASLLSAPGLIGVLGAGLAILMLTIALIDWRSFLIPDWLNAVALVLGLVHAAVQEADRLAAPMLAAMAIALVRGGALALVFLTIRSVYAHVRGRQGLGLGDVKLAAVAGTWLGWWMLPIAMEIAALAALSVYLLRQFVSGRPVRATNRVPFGLFFAPTIWLCWLMETMVF